MTKGAAYFVSPDGNVMLVSTSHVAAVIENPSLFGLTKAGIEAIYAEHGEGIGIEGTAREAILIPLIARGWIRIREYPDRYWSVNFHRASPKTKAYLRGWARRIVRRRSADPYLPVHLAGLGDGFCQRVELRTLATGGLFDTDDADRWKLTWPVTR